jgi:hypothetical protein
MVARTLLTAAPVARRLDGAGALRLGLMAAALATAVALFAFLWSWRALPESLDSRTYYEVLFWGGGHVLQFTWTLLMLVAWLWLADAIGARLPLSPRVVGLSLALVLVTPFVDLMWDVASVEHRRVLTWMMRLGGGLAIPPLALALVLALARLRRLPARARPLRAALVMSLLLFAAGGLIGFAASRLHSWALPTSCCRAWATAPRRRGWRCGSLTCMAPGSSCTSPGWCGPAVTGCNAKWRAPSRC